MFDAEFSTSRTLFEYKTSIFGVWINHLHKEEYSEDINTIHAIMLNNGFPTHTHTQNTYPQTPPYHIKQTNRQHHT